MAHIKVFAPFVCKLFELLVYLVGTSLFGIPGIWRIDALEPDAVHWTLGVLCEGFNLHYFS